MRERERLECEVSLAQHYIETLTNTLRCLDEAKGKLRASDAGFFDGMWDEMDELIARVRERKAEVTAYCDRLEDDLEVVTNGKHF